MLEKNSEQTAIVERLGSNGEGVIKIDGFTVFVPFCLPGEKVRFLILKTQKNYAFGKLLEIIEPSADRVKPVCQIFAKCGGCQLQHLSYEQQLVFKKQTVKDCLEKIGGISANVHPTVSSEKSYFYREKLQLPIRKTRCGNQIGFFRENSHDIVEVNDCVIQRKWSKKLIELTKKFIDNSGLTCFDESTGKGLLKHLVAKSVDNTLMVILVITEKKTNLFDRYIDELKTEFKHLSFFININSLNNNVVMGDKTICLYGSDRVRYIEHGLELEAGAYSFMQINADVRKKLYERAVELVSADNNTVVIDAYSGAGTMTAMFAKTAKKAIGIECIPEATACADRTKELNGLTQKMQNICGLCEDIMPDIITQIKSENCKSAVVIDPPRKGCARSVVESIRLAEPDKIVYISCNPATLARDLGLLLGTLKEENSEIKKNSEPYNNYEIVTVEPFDMFSQCKHVETLVFITRKLAN